MRFVKQHQNRLISVPKRCKSFSFDVNQQAESLVEWQQQYDQHSSGVFNGYLDELKLGGVHLFEEFTNQTLQQQCSINENCLWFGFCLHSQQPKINNQEIVPGQIMMRPSDTSFELITPPDCYRYGLVVDLDKLYKEMGCVDAEIYQTRSYNMQATAPNQYISYELAKLIQLLLNKSTGPISQNILNDKSHPERLIKLMPLITSKITDLLTQLDYGEECVEIPRCQKQRVINNINNHIKATKHYPLTITELCNITHLSRRVLQYCFKQVLGVSPMQYIRGCRLNEIRRILLKTNTDIIIYELALDFGFFHIGTFNNQYKQLFGETPTQTLERAPNYKQAIFKSKG